MRRLEEFILEKLKVSKVQRTTYHPNSKEELVDLIIKEIEAKGPSCSLNHADKPDGHFKDICFIRRVSGREEYSSILVS